MTAPTDSHGRRNVMIAGGVVLFHAAALWALQSGLLRRAVEVVVPVSVISETLTPPAPKADTPPPPEPVKREPVQHKAPTPPAPQPVAVPDPTPAPSAPVGVATPQPPAPPIAAPMQAAPAPAPAPRVELPVTDADYLENAREPYPPVSRRLGEQGKVVVHVLIGADGSAKQAQIRQSSGYERLDQAALARVLKRRYRPGRRGGVPEDMWFNVPIDFVLE